MCISYPSQAATILRKIHSREDASEHVTGGTWQELLDKGYLVPYWNGSRPSITPEGQCWLEGQNQI